MRDINAENLLPPMLIAAQQEIAQDWPKVQNYMQQQLQILAQSLTQFTKLYIAKQITKAELTSDLEEVKSTTKMAWITEAGLELEIATAVLQKVLSAVKSLINNLINFELL